MVKIADAQHINKFVVNCGRTGSFLTGLNGLFPVIVADTNVFSVGFQRCRHPALQ